MRRPESRLAGRHDARIRHRTESSRGGVIGIWDLGDRNTHAVPQGGTPEMWRMDRHPGFRLAAHPGLLHVAPLGAGLRTPPAMSPRPERGSDSAGHVAPPSGAWTSSSGRIGLRSSSSMESVFNLSTSRRDSASRGPRITRAVLRRMFDSDDAPADDRYTGAPVPPGTD